MRDSAKMKYVVPINSASKFGLVYKSSSGRTESDVFETIEDLMLATPLPKIVAAQLAHLGQDESTSVHKNEVLIIKGETVCERGSQVYVVAVGSIHSVISRLTCY